VSDTFFRILTIWGDNMKIICAVCGKDMGKKDGKGVDGISHSYCEKCYQKIMKEIKNA